MDEQELNYLVTKSNYFIMNNRYDLTMQEQRIIFKLASMIQPDDTEFHEYLIKTKDFMEFLDLKGQSGYSELKRITKGLISKVMEIPSEDGIIRQFAWLSGATYYPDGTMELKFNSELKPFMLELKKRFTTFELKNVIAMKCKYGPRIYEILKCNEFKSQGYVVIEVEELKKLLKLEQKYKLYSDFKRKVIIPAQKDISEMSDIDFDFQEIKQNKRVTHIKFIIRNNKTIQNNIVRTDVSNTSTSAETDSSTDKNQEQENEYPFFSMSDSDMVSEVGENEYIGELYALMKEKDVTLDEVKAIYENAEGNVQVIREVYEYCKNREAANFVGLMIHMVRPGVFKKPKSSTKKTDFHNFNERDYNFEELEKELLRAQESH